MKAQELKDILSHIIKTEGDFEVELSIKKHKQVPIDQVCLFSEACFCDTADRGVDGKVVSLRDWPY